MIPFKGSKTDYAMQGSTSLSDKACLHVFHVSPCPHAGLYLMHLRGEEVRLKISNLMSYILVAGLG